MHLLSSRNRSEFLATPQLIRFDYVRGADGFEPTLLIKGSTLLLKYIALGVRMQLAFAWLGDHLLYALKVYDDEAKPGVLWSVLEHGEEKVALAALAQGKSCQIFLFNELAVNVAWAVFPIAIEAELTSMVAGAVVGQINYTAFEDRVSKVLDRFHHEIKSNSGLVIADVRGTTAWKPIFNHFITSHATASLIDFFDKDEGNQQEQIAIWLTDNLHPGGVHRGPQVPKGKGTRELTDVILSYEFGSILMESKVLAILSRAHLPNRGKLARDISGDITKAFGQLRGAMRRLKDGAPVSSKIGVLLDIERTQPMHGIVLIPDLDLIDDRDAYGQVFIENFIKATGGWPHLLDIAELLRIVQAAEMIARCDSKITPMIAFDYYLMERIKKATEAGSLCIEVLLHLEDPH